MVQTFLGMARTILIQLNNMENTKKTFGSSKKFINGNALEWETVGEGVKRKIMGYDDKIMLVKVHFDEGGIGQMHEHYHSQVTYVESLSLIHI